MSTRAGRRSYGRDVRRRTANKRVGHELAYLIVCGPTVTVVLVIVGACAWLWFNVDHHRLAQVALVSGAVCVIVWLVWVIKGLGLHTRMMALAEGRTRSAYGHLVGLAGLCLIGGSILLAGGQ